jgi:hypothetical protein
MTLKYYLGISILYCVLSTAELALNNNHSLTVVSIWYVFRFPYYEKKRFKCDGKQSTNINKTINHVLPLTIEHKKNTTYGIGNPVPGLGQAQEWDGVKPVVYDCLWWNY